MERVALTTGLLIVCLVAGCAKEAGSPECGNGVIDQELGEECDGDQVGGRRCTDLGHPGGTLGCHPPGHAQQCRFDRSQCTGPECGNSQVDDGEQCDGPDLAGQSCQLLGFLGGTLGCTLECRFDVELCTSPECGNNVQEPGELCDGTELVGETCVSRGYTAGQLACAADCLSFDESGCSSAPVCGNGAVEGSETCDGSNLSGQSCQSIGYLGGVLSCRAPGTTDECTLDESACTGTPNCTIDYPVGLLQTAVPQIVNGSMAGAGDENVLTCSALGNDQIITFSTAQQGSLQVDFDFSTVPPSPRYFGLNGAGSDGCPATEVDCQDTFAAESGTIVFGPLGPGTYCLIVEEMLPLASPYTVTLTLLP